jgi:hypothetical protein
MASESTGIIAKYPPRDGRNWDLQCARCGSSCHYQDCDQCEDGFDGHDCGEDCCACYRPEDNVICQICDGDGGWYQRHQKIGFGKRLHHVSFACWPTLIFKRTGTPNGPFAIRTTRSTIPTTGSTLGGIYRDCDDERHVYHCDVGEIDHMTVTRITEPLSQEWMEDRYDASRAKYE